MENELRDVFRFSNFVPLPPRSLSQFISDFFSTYSLCHIVVEQEAVSGDFFNMSMPHFNLKYF